VNPGWDNEPRRSGRGRVYAHASPRGYRDWLADTLIQRAPKLPQSQRLVFINAWNEWAEGAVLEPDARLGHAWLDATRRALQQAAGATPPADPHPYAVIHAWYPEVLDELVRALRNSGLDWRLIVTTAPERETEVRARLAQQAPDAELEVFPNHGRDVLPFLHVANRLLDEGARVMLKLHTKRSTHRRDGDAWRGELLSRLLSPARAAAIAQGFDKDPTLGLVAAEGHVQPLHYYWGANRDTVQLLSVLLGIPEPDPERDTFIAGTMFWARLDALRPLLDAHLDPWRFESEAGQVDGTFAHAVERIIALAARSTGFHTATAVALSGEPEPDDAYPYARRDH
jgi:lipopolysaccharide biosynthesis protein